MATLNVPGAYPSIAAAMAAAAAGDTILVASGYGGNEGVSVTKNNITLNAPANVPNLTLYVQSGVTGLTLAGASPITVVADGVSNAVTMTGNAGANYLRGGANNDTLYGGGGDDSFGQSNGTDALYGGSGNDSLNISGGAGSFDGGADTDVVYSQDLGSWTFTNTEVLDTYNVYATTAQLSSFSTIRYSGSSTPYQITLHLTGAGGALDLSNKVAAGYSVYVVGDYYAPLTAAMTLTGSMGNDFIRGGGYNDTLYGAGGDDTFERSDGVDALYGGAGNDTFNLNNGGSGSFDGGADTDVVYSGDLAGWSFTNTEVLDTSSVTATTSQLASFSTIRYSGSTTPYQIYIRVTGAGGTVDLSNKVAAGYSVNVVGDYYYAPLTAAMTLTGSMGNDFLRGGGYNDTLYGAGGDDTFERSDGVDALYGGAGNDTFNLNNGGSGSFDGGADTDVVYSGDLAGWSFTNTEVLDTSSVRATTAQLASFSTIRYSGSTTPYQITLLVGGSGGTVDLSNKVAAGYSVNVIGDYYYAPLTAAMTLTGSMGNDFIRGGAYNDTLYGAGGDDTFERSDGVDALYGGAGNDTFNLNNGGAGSFDGGADTDVVYSGDLAGWSFTNTEVLDTSSVRATTAQLASFSTIRYSGSTTPYQITLLVGGPGGTVDLSNKVAAGYSVNVVGDYYYAPLTAAMTLTGSMGGDHFRSSQYNDTLYGAGGDDTLEVNGGSGSFDGGADTDVVYSGDLAGWSFTNTEVLDTSSVTATTSQLASFSTIRDSGSATPYQIYLRVKDAGGTVDLSNKVAAGYSVYVIGDYYYAPLTAAMTLTGSMGNDFIRGGRYNDTLYGAGGDDTFERSDGVDALYGGAGNDTLNFNGGAGSFDGGADTDVVYSGDLGSWSFTNVEVLDTSGVYATPAQLGSFSTIRYSGSPTPYQIYLRVTGAGGTVDLSNKVAAGYSVYVLDAGLTSAVTLTGSAGNDEIRLQGGTYNDTIYGGGGDDYLDGFGGADMLYGGVGNDTFSSGYYNGDNAGDQLYGGVGNDVFNLYTGGGFVDGGADVDTVVAPNGDLSGWSFTNVEVLDAPSVLATLAQLNSFSTIRYGSYVNYQVSLGLRGPGGTLDLSTRFAAGYTAYVFDNGLTSAVTLTGSAGGDNLNGSAFGDTIYGGGGDDYLDGNGGSDALYGGAGNDFLSGGPGDYLDGGAGNDTLHSYGGGATLHGGVGNDLLQGLSGDTATYFDATGGVAVNLTVTTAQNVGGGAGVDTLTNIANVTGSAFNDSLTGDANANILTGGAGDDNLFGGAGNDTIDGGAGNDSLVGGDDVDTLSYASAAGPVTLDLAVATAQNTGGGGTDIVKQFENLVGSSYADTLTGTGAANYIFGGAGNDSISGGAGNDVLYGGDGDDTLVGGVGADTLYGGGDGVVFSFGANYYKLVPTVANFPQAQSIAAAQTLNGVAGTLVTIYSAAENTFVSNTVAGGALFWLGGYDTTGTGTWYWLSGGAPTQQFWSGGVSGSAVGGLYSNWASGQPDNIGAQTAMTGNWSGSAWDNLEPYSTVGNPVVVVEWSAAVVGATPFGADTASYASSGGKVTINLATNVNTGGDAAGDLLYNMRNVVGSAFDDSLTGDASANVLQGGAGNDALSGADGADTLEGGAGNDSLDGGAGVDTASYASAASGVTVNLATTAAQNTGGAGTDTIANVENLAGSAFADALTGSAGANALDGGAGDDTLNGGGGADALYGGLGTDTAVTAATWRATTVTSPSAGVYQLAFNGNVVTASGVELFQFTNGTFAASAILNDAPTAADDADATLVEAGAGGPGAASAAGLALANDTDPDTPLGDALTVMGARAGTEAGGGAFQAVSGPTVVQGVYGALTIAANGAWTYALNNSDPDTQALTAGRNGTETFTYQITDAGGLTDTAQLTLTIAGSNDAPVAADDSDATLIEAGVTPGIAATAGNVVANDVDVESPPDAAPTVTAVRTGTEGAGGAFTTLSGPTVVQGVYGALTISASGAWTYALDNSDPDTQALTAGRNGTEAFTYQIMDAGGLIDTAQLTLTVAGANDAPVAADDADATLVEAGAGTPGVAATGGNVIANDADAESPPDAAPTVAGVRTGAEGAGGAFTALSGPTVVQGVYGALTISASGAWTYALDNSDPDTQALTAGRNGTETFTYQITDAGGLTDTAQLTLTIAGANDAPVAADDADATLVEAGASSVGVASTSGNVVSNDVDAESPPDAAPVVTGVRTGTESAGGAFTALSGPTVVQGTYGALTISTNGAWTYALNNSDPDTQALTAGRNGTETFAYQVTDAGGLTDTAQLTLTIAGSNDAPVANADAGIFVSRGSTIVIPAAWLLANDADVDGDALSVQGVSAATNGIVSFDGQNVSFTSTTDTAPATATFSYAATDGQASASGLASLQLVTTTSGNDTRTVATAAGGLSFIDGGAGNDVLTGGAGNDTLVGGANNDALNGGSGVDVLYGGTGDDRLYVDNPADLALENAGEGADSVYASADYALGAGQSIEFLYANAGSAGLTLTGNELANTLYGGTGPDRLRGGAGNDVVNGGAGVDTMEGGAGDDRFYVDTSADQVLEASGQGADTVYAAANWTIAPGQEIEALVANAGSTALTLTGNELANAITGGGGNDALYGGGAADALYGGGGNDTIDGGSGNDLLYGGLGADQMTGGFGDDKIVVDDPGDRVFEASGQGLDSVLASVDWSIAPGQSVEFLYANAGATGLTLTGNELAQTLVGGAGNDRLYGGLGNDTLLGGAGDDTLTGGANDDTYNVDRATDVVVEDPNAGVDTIYTTVNWTLGDNVENLGAASGAGPLALTGNGVGNVLNGGAGADTLDGGAGNDSINGGSGADLMTGGTGDDRFFVDNAGDRVFEQSGEGVDTVFAGVDWTLNAGQYVDVIYANAGALGLSLTGNELANSLFGVGGADHLYGGAGNDSLTGGAGADTLEGGAGDDKYFVDSADRIVEAAGQGSDAVYALNNFTLGAGQSIETLVANAGATGLTIVGNEVSQVLLGGAGNDSLVGGAGNDTLTGGAGADTLRGGLDDDIYNVGAGDVVIEDPNAGRDAVYTAIDWTLSDNIEILGAAAGAGALSLTGNGLDNSLYGGAGNDTISGGAGNDILYGGPGNDVMRGGTGDDKYYVTDAGDQVFENAGEGADTVYASVDFTLPSGVAVESIVAASGAPALALGGNELANAITGGAFADVLNGRDGADTISGGLGDDTITGGGAGDALTGGGGADVFIYTSLSDSGFGAARDTIADFTPGTDRIDVSGLQAVTGASTDQAFAWLGTGAFTHHAGELHQITLGSNTVVEGDVTGDGVTDFQIILTGPKTLGAGDFVL